MYVAASSAALTASVGEKKCFNYLHVGPRYRLVPTIQLLLYRIIMLRDLTKHRQYRV